MEQIEKQIFVDWNLKGFVGNSQIGGIRVSFISRVVVTLISKRKVSDFIPLALHVVLAREVNRY